MSMKLFRWSLVPALALAVFAACSDSGLLSDQLTAPDAPSLARGGVKGANSERGKGPRIRVKVKGKKATTAATALSVPTELEYVLAVGQYADGYESQVQTQFNPGTAAALQIPELGYRVAIPANALSQPATFKLKAVKKTAYNEQGQAYNFLAVELKAIALDGVTDLGERGFNVDVDLFMAPVGVVNADASQLQIVWQEASNSYSTVECYQTFASAVSTANACVSRLGDGTVHARLKHFSAYNLAFPRE